jgi:hypothetical protein
MVDDSFTLFVFGPSSESFNATEGFLLITFSSEIELFLDDNVDDGLSLSAGK